WGGKSGPAAVPGQPEASRLVLRVRAEEMPPRRELVAASVKPMESHELQTVVDWIAAGMPASDESPDVATEHPDTLVTDRDRQFWAFQPPSDIRPDAAVLPPSYQQRVRNPVDVLVFARLHQQKLVPAAEADRTTLIRRVTFDLTGLPPDPDDVAEFLADGVPGAYERVVDRLLASPRFGERWARHWLDVAGYSDSEGAQNEDRVRPHMWRYRDYVIRAWNSDKPYDRFLQEQLAGDELADYANAPEITPEIYDNLVATGFLRTAPDRTFAEITNFVPDRLEVIADEVQILGSAVLALTLQCSRCHSHKFDPLPQRDYFRLAATLKDALDEHDWLGPEARQLPHVLSAERQSWEQANRRVSERVAELQRQLAEATDEAQKKKLNGELREVEAGRPPQPMIRALWSRGAPSPTYVLKRGNYLTPDREVGPGVPSVLTDGRSPFVVSPPWPGAPTTGRRLALARWLTRPDHPLTARVIVNRIWRHHFGTGIVATLGNFGTTGDRPSHPELLDWLARHLVDRGWSLKAIHRLIVTSTTYRLSSDRTPDLIAADPDHRLLSHLPLRRVEAEVLRDAMLYVAGQLDESRFGPPVGVTVGSDGSVSVAGKPGAHRRSIYLLHRRTQMPTILEVFDSPQMGPNCIDRDESIVATQALHLLNNATVMDIAGHLARRVTREAGTHPGDQVDRAHQLAFGRLPTETERQLGAESLQALRQRWSEQPPSAEGQDSAAAPDVGWAALRNYCHAMLNSAAFLYIE
ncbi:MAG: PSD1 and planctomycete cytochrome C domain-containing protein, partial [Pirellulaceae bacterium]